MATGRVPTTANSPLTAKGDLFGYSTAPARLAVGNDGEQIVADSSTSTGLRYSANFAAGKNKIINGDFGVWQRGTTFANSLNGSYSTDRFLNIYDGTGATRAISQQTFTPGTAPVVGYEGKYFFRFNQTVAGTGGSFNIIQQPIEEVQTFAGQTISISFWAKSDSSRSIANVDVGQNFGSGGSGFVSTNATLTSGSATIGTGWQRVTYSVAVPSISGKTIGSSSSLNIRIWLPANSTFTLDFWGVQVEYGPVATAFQTATGTIQGELAACQRYYFRRSGTTNNLFANSAVAYSSTLTMAFIQPPQVMRVAPTSFDMANIQYVQYDEASFGTITSPILNGSRTTESQIIIYGTSSGMTTGRFGTWQGSASGAFLGFSAEL